VVVEEEEEGHSVERTPSAVVVVEEEEEGHSVD
jgi:hypothetical protein